VRFAAERQHHQLLLQIAALATNLALQLQQQPHLLLLASWELCEQLQDQTG
jgi:hypothetical protein